jgi:hypothetical protein
MAVAPSTPTEVRVKWMTKEDECLAESWKEVSIDAVTGANQCSETYWVRVKKAFDERKFIDPNFQGIHMDHGYKAMGNYWGIIQARPRVASDMAYKTRSIAVRRTAPAWTARYAVDFDVVRPDSLAEFFRRVSPFVLQM